MEDTLVALLSMSLLLALVPLYLWRRRLDSRTPDQPPPEEGEPLVRQREGVVRGGAGAGAGAARRMRRRPAAASTSGASSSSAAATVEENADESDSEEDGEDGHYTAKVSKKREKKRQEREAQRQAEEAARDSRRTKQDRYEDMRRKRDEDREALELKLEEEAKARKEKEEEAAALDFEKWKGAFSVDEEGAAGNGAEDGSQDLLSGFMDYIKKHKCIPLEDLAAEFKLRNPDCIKRITQLEDMGRLSGVMDDRGKYTYISQEEMNVVADYIRREGRVSISLLVCKSNQFIDLEPKSGLADDMSSVEEIAVA